MWKLWLFGESGQFGMDSTDSQPQTGGGNNNLQIAPCMQDSQLPGPNLAGEQLTTYPGQRCLRPRADEGCLLDLLLLLAPKWLFPCENASFTREEP